ncbi:hypothetical protein [Rhizobium leguminosarum]|uniref:hypothetical protein n=1 Tax=Rhizobium leguminosarum TaxID=384 RepID=UPI002E0FE057|nr:hypothetical protein U8Q02_39925 [Rhizobium leguminosarum]
MTHVRHRKIATRLSDLEAAGIVGLTESDRALKLTGVSTPLAVDLCRLFVDGGWLVGIDDKDGRQTPVEWISDEFGPYCIVAWKPEDAASKIFPVQADDLRADLVTENARLREMIRRAAAGWKAEATDDALSVRSGEDVLEIDLTKPFVDPRHAATVETVTGLIPAIEALRGSALDRKGQREVWADNLRWMVEEIVAHPEWPIDKPSRWTGFIQGVLAVLGFMSVADERNRTRSFFHRAYDLLGFRRPKTKSIGDGEARA